MSRAHDADARVLLGASHIASYSSADTCRGGGEGEAEDEQGAKAAKRGRFLMVRSPTSEIASHSSADTWGGVDGVGLGVWCEGDGKGGWQQVRQIVSVVKRQ